MSGSATRQAGRHVIKSRGVCNAVEVIALVGLAVVAFFLGSSRPSDWFALPANSGGRWSSSASPAR
jgi:hypothetical protein